MQRSTSTMAVRSAERTRLSGKGWQWGRETQLLLEPGASPLPSLRAFGSELPLRDPVRTQAGFRSTLLVHGAGALHGVEHLFSALHALSSYGATGSLSLTLETDQSNAELPLLGGGAAEYFDACRPFFAAEAQTHDGADVGERRSVVVTREASYETGGSQYTFLPRDAFEVEVTFVGRCAEDATATWTGDPLDFAQRIAPARTFLWRSEISMLGDCAVHVDPRSVRILEDGARLTDDEPARHKLLDLLGDLYPFAILPRGRVVARRPGHARNLEVFRRAFSDGVLCLI